MPRPNVVPHLPANLFGVLLGGLLWSTAAHADVDLPGSRAFPESVVSASDGTLYISNIAEGGVLRKTPGGPVEAWIAPRAFGSGTTYGTLPDPRAGMLWVCSNDLSSSGLAASQDGKSAVIGFDLKTGKGRVTLGFPAGPVECNDLALGTDGSLYVTDTAQPRIFRRAPGGTGLELFASDPRFDDKGGGLDGIAVGSDGSLLVNTLGSGKLFRVALSADKAGQITELTLDRAIGSADGMRHEGGKHFLVVTGNGHLERLTVDGDHVAVQTLRDGLDEPTGVAIVGTEAFVAEGRLSYLFDKSRKGQQPPLPFRLRSVSLMPR